jgi:hypothetical protein
MRLGVGSSRTAATRTAKIPPLAHPPRAPAAADRAAEPAWPAQSGEVPQARFIVGKRRSCREVRSPEAPRLARAARRWVARPGGNVSKRPIIDTISFYRRAVESRDEESDRDDAGVSRMPFRTGGAASLAILAAVGEVDPLGTRKDGLDAFLDQKVEEGYVIETRSDTHAIIFRRPKGLKRFTSGPDPGRYVVQVDEAGITTMRPAEPRRT